VANALVHGEALGATTDTASLGLDLAAHAIVVMIVIIAGRVIPFFIETRLVGARRTAARQRKASPSSPPCSVSRPASQRGGVAGGRQQGWV